MDDSDDEVFFGPVSEAERAAIEKVERLKRKSGGEGINGFTAKDVANTLQEDVNSDAAHKDGEAYGRMSDVEAHSSTKPFHLSGLTFNGAEFSELCCQDFAQKDATEAEEYDCMDIPLYGKNHAKPQNAKEVFVKPQVTNQGDQIVNKEWDIPTYYKFYAQAQKCRKTLQVQTAISNEALEEEEICAPEPTSHPEDESNTLCSEQLQVSSVHANTGVFVHHSKEAVLHNLDNESDSVLCASSSSEGDLNNTLDEVDMLLKFGLEYIHGSDTNVENEENELPQLVWRQDASDPSNINNQEDSSLPEVKLTESRRAVLENLHQNLPRRNIPKKVNQNLGIKEKPIAKPLKHRKPLSFATIKSPVAAYIKRHPTKLMATAVKITPSATITSIKPNTFEPVEPKSCYQPQLCPQSPIGKPVLPVVSYESAPTVSCNELRMTPRAQKPVVLTPKVLKHAGRALLSTVPEYAGIKTSEVSVIVDKEVCETDTLSLNF